MTSPTKHSAEWLLTTEAIRNRCSIVYKAGISDNLENFGVNLEKLDNAARYVGKTIETIYPDLKIPYHARWRHFNSEGKNRWKELSKSLDGDLNERARTAFDLVVTSVLLDAGAGPLWRYKDPETSKILTRSEGLAIASLHAFQSGLFSGDKTRPLRADADGLLALTKSALGSALQVTDENKLAGLDGRVRLLNNLGSILHEKEELFGKSKCRIGNLFDYLKFHSKNNTITARQIFSAIITGLSGIWPGRVTLSGINLGDTWHHPVINTGAPSEGLVPFHKLSQWITYSLIEPIEEAGLKVNGINDLTALAEYRNGGLLLDLGVISPKHGRVEEEVHVCGSEVIVEWRALTIIIIEMLAERLRHILNLKEQELPLAKVLEGGTWAAGRNIAQVKRATGEPPIRIASDGSVF